MASTAELIRRLRKAGFHLEAHAKKHDIYVNPASGTKVTVWRHAREIPNGTYRTLLKNAGIG